MRYSRRTVILLGVCGALAAIAVLSTVLREPAAGRVLEISMRTSAGTTAQLSWDDGAGFDAAHVVRVPLARTPDGFQSVRFTLPASLPRTVRLAPMDQPGELFVEAMRVVDPDGSVVSDLNPRSLLPLQQIASVKREGRLVQIVIAPAATDPFLDITPACLDRPSAWYSLSSVTPLSLALVSGACLILILGSIAAVAAGPAERAAAGGGLTERAAAYGGRGRWAPVTWLAALFLITVAGKLVLMHWYPAPVPYLDQWDAEAGGLYIPFHEGCLSWRQMISFHNEHRVFFTRLLALALLAVNGQWDPQLQQVVNAGLHAVTGIAVALMLWRASVRRGLDFLVMFCAVIFALPFSWENTLGGFQSAFYFLLLFSLLALALTVRPVRSAAWCLGWLCVFCGLLTAAGGVLTAVTVGVVAVLRLVCGRSGGGETAINLAMSAAACGVGYGLASPPLQQHALLKAGSFQELIESLARNLAWPWVDTPGMFVVMWLPVVVLVAVMLWRRRHATAEDVLIVGLASWIVLQAAAVAYARGAGGAEPASRYMDFFSLGVLANAVALAALADRLRSHRAAWRCAVAVLAGWSVWTLVGTERISERMLPGAAARHGSMVTYEQVLRTFLEKDDIAAFASKGFTDVPHWNAGILGNAWLRHPYLRQILPPAIRQPLPLQPRSGSSTVFVDNGVYPTTPPDSMRHVLGSFNNIGNPAQGRFDSAPFHCEAGSRLRFDVAGYLGHGDLSLSVRGGEGRELAVRPAELPMERWIPTTVRCPGPIVTVTAVDSRADLWFAFTDPVEVPWASAAAEGLIQHAGGLLLAAVGLTLVALRFATP